MNQELIGKIEWCNKGVRYGKEAEMAIRAWGREWGEASVLGGGGSSNSKNGKSGKSRQEKSKGSLKNEKERKEGEEKK